jgi:hypothetical protein
MNKVSADSVYNYFHNENNSNWVFLLYMLELRWWYYESYYRNSKRYKTENSGG